MLTSVNAKLLNKSNCFTLSFSRVLSNYYKLVAICKREDVKDERKQPWSAFCASYTDNMESTVSLSRFSRDSAAGAGEEEVGLARTQNASNPAGEGVRKKLDHLEM